MGSSHPNLLVLVCLAYVIAGVTIESLDLISQPAYWALYGGIWGAVIACIMNIESEKPKQCSSCRNRYDGKNGNGYQPCSCGKRK